MGTARVHSLIFHNEASIPSITPPIREGLSGPKHILKVPPLNLDLKNPKSRVSKSGVSRDLVKADLSSQRLCV